MIRRGLAIIIMFAIVVISFIETMLWLLQAEIRISNEMLTVIILVISLLGLFILTGGRKKKEIDKKLWLKDDKDSILISESAIKQLVKNTLAKITSISSSEVYIKYNKEKNISLKLDLVLYPETNIVEVTEMIEKSIHESFDTVLDEKVTSIQTVVKGFNGQTKKS